MDAWTRAMYSSPFCCRANGQAGNQRQCSIQGSSSGSHRRSPPSQAKQRTWSSIPDIGRNICGKQLQQKNVELTNCIDA
ncbi:hypothetical protein MAR_016810 [Mya arenaria]|uniref:Uncharacterized protein n=1 Tax=Mya arenaria TaxID=6604 RepID=A0ABY7EDH2_MYAAR|nr:hypothetical protein MAR_016810 [Mya arenaria]